MNHQLKFLFIVIASFFYLESNAQVIGATGVGGDDDTQEQVVINHNAMKNRFKIGLMEAFYGELYYAYERKITKNLWLEIGGGPTNLFFGQWHLIKSERFTPRGVDLSFNDSINNDYGKMARIGLTYTMKNHEMGTIYYGGEIQYRDIVGTLRTKQDGIYSSGYSSEYLKINNEFIGARAKIGVTIYFEPSLNKRNKLRAFGLDYSFSLGLASMKTVRYEEVVETEQYTGFNKYTYVENTNKSIRPTYTVSIKLFSAF